jgi:hypothetical protein
MDEIIFLVEDCAEGGLTAKALGHSIFTEADSLNESRDAIKDAVNHHFDDEKQRIIRN